MAVEYFLLFWCFRKIILKKELIEKIKTISIEKTCESNINCRTYQEILDIASCKSSKLAGTLPLDKDLYYLMTWQKPKAFDEWGKFIYAIIDNKMGVSSEYKGDIQFVKFIDWKYSNIG